MKWKFNGVGSDSPFIPVQGKRSPWPAGEEHQTVWLSSSFSLEGCPEPLFGSHQARWPQQSHSWEFQPAHNTFPAAQLSAPNPTPELSLLGGVPCPQTCSSGWLMRVFVSECCSVNVTHCTNPGNNRGSSQHPRSFPAPTMKTHSWGTFHLLLLLSLFPVWSCFQENNRGQSR